MIYIYIIASCLLIIFSYLYNLLSNRTGIPSVLLLMLSGILVREALHYAEFSYSIPAQAVEFFGVLGLIMIILEAGLDLDLEQSKIKLIRNAFLSAFTIFALSAIACSLSLYWYLKEDFMSCLIYAIPLSIVSSAIVIPSISHLKEVKKEFLVYETSFSDILGILLFNHLIAGEALKLGRILSFGSSIFLALVLGLVFSFILLFLMTRIKTKVRFFMVFAILILLYSVGKILHLPSLFIILLFGLIVSNWDLKIFSRLYRFIKVEQVNDISHLLHSLTAESSFLIRTFFFFIFGLTIDIRLLLDAEVVITGSLLTIILFVIRFIYLRFFLKSHVFPELFFMPRGLITILLFYSIPEVFKLSTFNEGILFFIILFSSLIMVVGSISYGRPALQTIHGEVPYIADKLK